jgi:hypothetical protein
MTRGIEIKRRCFEDEGKKEVGFCRARFTCSPMVDMGLRTVGDGGLKVMGRLRLQVLASKISLCKIDVSLRTG